MIGHDLSDMKDEISGVENFGPDLSWLFVLSWNIAFLPTVSVRGSTAMNALV